MSFELHIPLSRGECLSNVSLFNLYFERVAKRSSMKKANIHSQQVILKQSGDFLLFFHIYVLINVCNGVNIFIGFMFYRVLSNK